MSRIGKKPVDLPSGVTANISGQTVEVKGPKGTRSFTATDDVTIEQGDNVPKVFHGHQRSAATGGQGEQAHNGPGHDTQCSLGTDEPMLQVVSGVVLQHLVHTAQYGAVGGNHLQSQYQLTHHAVAQHVNTTGVGSDVAADGAAAACTQVQGEEQSLLPRCLLQLLQYHARLYGGSTADRIDGADGVHALQ